MEGRPGVMETTLNEVQGLRRDGEHPARAQSGPRDARGGRAAARSPEGVDRAGRARPGRTPLLRPAPEPRGGDLALRSLLRACRRSSPMRWKVSGSDRTSARAGPPPTPRNGSSSRTSRCIRTGSRIASWPRAPGSARAGPSRSSRREGTRWGPSPSTTASRRGPSSFEIEFVLRTAPDRRNRHRARRGAAGARHERGALPPAGRVHSRGLLADGLDHAQDAVREPRLRVDLGALVPEPARRFAELVLRHPSR